METAAPGPPDGFSSPLLVFADSTVPSSLNPEPYSQQINDASLEFPDQFATYVLPRPE
jgi:hypothetical protein